MSPGLGEEAKAASVISVSSSKHKRRVDRAFIFRRIIDLKRRFIRCYFVNIIAALIQLLFHGISLTGNFSLIYGQPDLLTAIVTFLFACFLMILGSTICIYAMTKILVKWALILGYAIVMTAVFLNTAAAFGEHVFPAGPERIYGFRRDVIEDCQAYPDHTFKFITNPESRKGEPLMAEDEEHEHSPEEEETFLFHGELGASTEATVTEAYICDEVLYHVGSFKRSYVSMVLVLIVFVVTVALSVVDIGRLLWINYKGTVYSILPPSLVEPYEDYDELLRHSHSLGSLEIQTQVLTHAKQKQKSFTEERRQHYLKMNRDHVVEIERQIEQ